MAWRRALAWSVAAVALGVIAIGSLAAIPNGGGTGSGLPIPFSATSAAPALAALAPGGLVPKDIANTILVPVGFAPVKYGNLNVYGTSFDRALVARVGLNPLQLERFFRAALPDEGWRIENVTRIPGGEEIFATKAGSDGYYWEVGIKDPYGRRGEVQLRLLQVTFS